MICEQCEYNLSEENSFLCPECIDKNLPIAEGDLPGFRITEDDTSPASCECDDEMCNSCLTFQRMDAVHTSILAL